MARQVRFGIVGTGKISEWVIAGARDDARFHAVAVCSRSEVTGREFSERNGIARVYTSVAEMAAAPDIDAVYVATPNSTHAAIAIECMNHGKHVLCEKPMAASAAQAKEMAQCAAHNGVLLMEAMIATLNPNFALLRQYLPKLGVIRRYFGCYCQYSSRYDKLKEGIVMNAWRPELANGAIMDIGIYTIYPMVALFGAPNSVSAQALILSTGVDGEGSATFEYDGMIANVMYSKISNSYLPSELEGESANLLVDKIHTIEQMQFVPRPMPGSGRGPKAESIEIGNELSHDRYYYEIKEFIDCIVRGDTQSEMNSLFNSITTLEIIDEIRRQTGVVFPTEC